MSETPLTEIEVELFTELVSTDHDRNNNWVNFDPDYTRGETARARRRAWIEERMTGNYREYRLTDKGRARIVAHNNPTEKTVSEQESKSSPKAG